MGVIMQKTFNQLICHYTGVGKNIKKCIILIDKQEWYTFIGLLNNDVLIIYIGNLILIIYHRMH